MSLQLRSELLGLRMLMSISLLLFRGHIVSACVLLTGGLFACARHDELLQLRSVTAFAWLPSRVTFKLPSAGTYHCWFGLCKCLSIGGTCRTFGSCSMVNAVNCGHCASSYAGLELGRGHALRGGLGAPLHFSTLAGPAAVCSER